MSKSRKLQDPIIPLWVTQGAYYMQWLLSKKDLIAFLVNTNHFDS